ncbi:MAG: N-isopropylammelide isopropylaminohydrolase, partial [Brevibacterium aurantiacum]
MTILRNVRLFPRTADAEAVDVEIKDGRFSSFTPHSSGTTSAGEIDGAGRALLPSLGDVHA